MGIDGEVTGLECQTPLGQNQYVSPQLLEEADFLSNGTYAR